MSCKSALYAAMQTPTAVAVDGVIPLGSLIRRYGCDVALNGNSVNITGAGYYDVDASVTVTPTAAGTVTVTLYKKRRRRSRRDRIRDCCRQRHGRSQHSGACAAVLLRGRFRSDAGAHRCRCYGQ